MNALMNLIAIPLGWLMRGCYYLIKNYGLALLLFTFLTRLLMFPLNVKQQKSTARMAMLNPELEKLKKKYGKNQEKLQEEQMKLYAKANANPMMSCMPSLVSLVVIWALIPVVYGPLTYVTNLDKNDVERSNEMIKNIYVVSEEVKSKNTTIEKLIEGYQSKGKDPYQELENLITNEDKYPKSYKALGSDEQSINDVMQAIKKHDDIDKFMLDTDKISDKIVQSRPELMTFNIVSKDDGKYADILQENIRKEAQDFKYEFFGIYLGKIPSYKNIDATTFIPVFCFIFQILISVVSQHYSKKNNPAMQNMGGCGMNGMIYGMSLISLVIGFSYPAGLGLYWCFSSVVGLIQVVVLNKIYTPEYIAKLIEKDAAKQKKKGKQSFMQKMAEAQMVSQGKDPKEIKKEIAEEEGIEYEEPKKKSKTELKEEQRRKLNEARKRMAEKYGDEYDENDD